MKKLLILGLLILSLSLAPVPGTPIARAADTANGAKIFQVHCAGCHPGGGNIIRRGKNLKKRALKRYKRDSLGAIASLVTKGKSPMSAYKDRLTAQEIEDVSAYVLEQAEKNWK
ncbi:MAG: c-type cytochrome [Hormoscilla sp. GM102CHS1]|nr:c-type cytochrome [Hormoscilla sp. GM102CHS1]